MAVFPSMIRVSVIIVWRGVVFDDADKYGHCPWISVNARIFGQQRQF